MYSDYTCVLRELGLCLAVGVVFLYLKIVSSYGYWKKLGVPFQRPLPLFGSVFEALLGLESVPETQVAIYNEFEDAKCVGIYFMTRPQLLVKDPDLIKRVLVTDFGSFHDRGLSVDSKINALLENVLHSKENQWKSLRSKLSSLYGAGKVSSTVGLLGECAATTVEALLGCASSSVPLDAHAVASKYAADVIGTCVFGLSPSALVNSSAYFHRVFTEACGSVGWRSRLRATCRLLHPKLVDLLRLKSFPKKLEQYFVNLVKGSVKLRESGIREQNDFIKLLMDMKERTVTVESEDKTGADDSFRECLMVANAFIFFMAGYQTTAATLCYCLYELANNEHVQEKLHAVIKTEVNRQGGKVTYSVLTSLPYLDQVLDETLRKYPAVTVILRKTTKEYKLPWLDVTLPPGSRIDIPVYAIHHDPRIYPQPELFDPQRFSKENKAKLKTGTYLPFGCGPRICIGMQFAMMELKVCLVMILMKYKISRNAKTPVTISYRHRSPLLLIPRNKILLSVTLRSD